MRILVIEDNSDIAANIGDYLEEKGHVVDFAGDGVTGLHLAVVHDFDAIVLDLTLPGMDGLELCRKLRQEARRQTPVLMLTARDALDQKLTGFDSGADDYMVKPFALAELSARLRAVMRRGAARENVLRVADLEMDTLRRVVRRAGKTIDLKPKEYALLEFLVRNTDRPVTKSLIIEHVWNIHFDSVSNVVEVHINSLRNKIDRGFARPLIHTIRGVGYILTDNPPA